MNVFDIKAKILNSLSFDCKSSMKDARIGFCSAITFDAANSIMNELHFPL